jgi:hypothetical protein
MPVYGSPASELDGSGEIQGGCLSRTGIVLASGSGRDAGSDARPGIFGSMLTVRSDRWHQSNVHPEGSILGGVPP